MDREPLASDNIEPFKGGDSIEKLMQLAQQAIVEGHQVGDELHIAIPVDDKMTYWGTGIWHITEEGRPVRVDDLFSEILGGALKRNVVVSGFDTRMNAETGVSHSTIRAIITE